MSTEKKGAYGNAASEGSHRRTWDTEAYREKAREKDREERERMQENEERMRKGGYLPVSAHDLPLTC